MAQSESDCVKLLDEDDGFSYGSLSIQSSVERATDVQGRSYGVALLAAAGALCAVAAGASFVVFAVVVAKAAPDTQTSQPDRRAFANGLRRAACLLLLSSSVAIAFGVLEVELLLRAADRVATRLSKRLFASILRKPMVWFDRHASGQIVATVLDDVEKMRHGLGEKLALCIHFGAKLAGAAIVSVVFSWRMAVISFSLLPVGVLFGHYCLRRAKVAMAAAQKESAAAAAVAEEAIVAIRTVQTFNGQGMEAQRYEAALRRAQRDALKKEFWLAIGFGGIVLQNFSLGIAMWYSVDLVCSELLSVNDMLVPLLAVMKATISAREFFYYLAAVSTAAHAMTVVKGNLTEPVAPNRTRKGGARVRGGRIEFRNVIFAYPSRLLVNALNGVSFTVEPSHSLAIVGPSGGGKSTVVRLLLRLYQPDSGQILIDGSDIRQMDAARLRQAIGVVGQEPALFNASIRENIVLGAVSRTDPSASDVRRAATEADAHRFVARLPMKYDTVVGEGGAQLSGGQKQRIAIARAVVRSPRILLLDEATSALDTKSERAVQAAVRAVERSRTTVSVAHRLSTIRHAHQILVLDKGVVVERGNHAELMQLGGVYARLHEEQSADFVDDDSEDEPDDDDVQRIDAGLLSSTSTVSTHFSARSGARAMQLETAASYCDLLKTAWQAAPLSLAAALFFCCAVAFCCIAFAYVFGCFVTSFGSESRQTLTYYAFLVIVIACLARAPLNAMAFYAVGSMAELTGLRMACRVFGHILQQDGRFFDDARHSVGSLLLRLTIDVDTLKNGLRAPLGTIFWGVACVPMVAAVVGVVEWRLLPAVAAVCAVNALAAWLCGRGASGVQARLGQAERRVAQTLTECVEQVATVRALACERRLQARFGAELEAASGARLAAIRVFGLRFGIVQSKLVVQAAVAFLIASLLVDISDCSLNHVYALLTVLLIGLEGFGTHFTDVLNAKRANESLHEILCQNPHIEIFGGSKQVPVPKVNGTIAFNRVTFTYPRRSWVPILRGLSLRITRGQSLAVVGSSGSGKSTLVQLLQRFYDPLSGTILADETDIRNVSLSDLRENVVAVSQEPIVFNRSLLENIVYGLTDVPFERVRQAAIAADIHEFIRKLPEGYATLAGERGALLSGGEKQRVAIARALVRSPPLLCLDEATSALDASTERRVLPALLARDEGATRLLVAHRLSTARAADCIAVLRRGVVVEMGSHEQLIRLRGLYFAMVNRQNGRSDSAAIA